MTTSPSFTEHGTEPDSNSVPVTPFEMPDRVHRLEAEVAELRETITRFADLMIGEVKDLRQSHAESPAPPSAVSDAAPSTATRHNFANGHVAVHTEQVASRRPWLLMELLRDLSTTTRMYLDPRYRVRRATQMLVPLILLLFAFSSFFFNIVFTLPFVSSVLEKLVDVILAVLLYKVVSRELVRYREVVAQLIAWQTHQVRTTTAVVSGEPATTRLETE